MTSLRCLFSCRTYTVESGVYTLEQDMFKKVHAYNHELPLWRSTCSMVPCITRAEYAYLLSPLLRMAVL